MNIWEANSKSFSFLHEFLRMCAISNQQQLEILDAPSADTVFYLGRVYSS